MTIDDPQALRALYLAPAPRAPRAPRKQPDALWPASARVDRTVPETMGQMIDDHPGLAEPAETSAQMRACYAADL